MRVFFQKSRELIEAAEVAMIEHSDGLVVNYSVSDTTVWVIP